MILAASPPQHTAKNDYDRPGSSAEQSLRNIATALQKANESKEPDRGCDPSQEDRSSDLCAQWKAADAAATATIWERRTFWLNVAAFAVGFLTLIAAGFAAWFAKSASDAAHQSLRLDNKVADAQTRPYLFIDKLDVDEEYPNRFQITIWLKNFGNVPARDIKVRSLCYFAGDLINLSDFGNEYFPVDAGVAAPGHCRRTFERFCLTPERYQRIKRGWLYLFLRIEYIYTDGAKSDFSEAVDYFANGFGFDKRVFYLLTDATKAMELERRDMMRGLRTHRRLCKSKLRGHRHDRPKA